MNVKAFPEDPGDANKRVSLTGDTKEFRWL